MTIIIRYFCERVCACVHMHTCVHTFSIIISFVTLILIFPIPVFPFLELLWKNGKTSGKTDRQQQEGTHYQADNTTDSQGWTFLQTWQVKNVLSTPAFNAYTTHYTGVIWWVLIFFLSTVQFAGSLGKLTVSSVNNPRKMIDAVVTARSDDEVCILIFNANLINKQVSRGC